MPLLAVASKTTPPTPPPSNQLSKSWFREKYLLGAYETHYEYTLHRYQKDDNDWDMCPDIYKTATIFAITGRYTTEIKQTCTSVYVQKTNNKKTHYRPAPDMRLTHINILNVPQFLGEMVCYIFEFVMIVMSIILASCSTLFMILLLFCQY